MGVWKNNLIETDIFQYMVVNNANSCNHLVDCSSHTYRNGKLTSLHIHKVSSNRAMTPRINVDTLYRLVNTK